MAEERVLRCPHRCPFCAFYEARDALQEGISGCVPPAVSSHLNKAGRELLLAVRALLDTGLEGLSQPAKSPSRRRTQRIKVE